MLVARWVLAGDRIPYGVQGPVVATDFRAHDVRDGVLESAKDAGAARDFADSRATRVVLEDHDIADEVGGVRAREVQEHAVLTGDRDHPHLADDGSCAHGASISSEGIILSLPEAGA